MMLTVLRVDHDVLWLQVTMHVTAAVHILQCQCYLEADKLDLLLRELALVVPIVVDQCGTTEFEHHVHNIVLHEALQQLDDAWVRFELLQGCELHVLKTFALRVGELHDLESHGLVSALVACTVDRTIGATADLIQQREVLHG